MRKFLKLKFNSVCYEDSMISSKYDRLSNEVILNINEISFIRKAPSNLGYAVTMTNGTIYTISSGEMNKIFKEISVL